jgi:hypothetical protein
VDGVVLAREQVTQRSRWDQSQNRRIHGALDLQPQAASIRSLKATLERARKRLAWQGGLLEFSADLYRPIVLSPKESQRVGISAPS